MQLKRLRSNEYGNVGKHIEQSTKQRATADLNLHQIEGSAAKVGRSGLQASIWEEKHAEAAPLFSKPAYPLVLEKHFTTSKYNNIFAAADRKQQKTIVTRSNRCPNRHLPLPLVSGIGAGSC